MPPSLELTSKFSHTVLLGKFGKYMANKVKVPLMNTIIRLANKYPVPTRENVIHPNTRRLLDIQDKLFEYETNPGRKPLLMAGIKVLTAEYEHNPYYRYRFDWFIDEIKKSGWLPRSTRPMSSWKEWRDIPEGTVFSPQALSGIMKAEEPQRSVLLRDFILCAGEERVFEN